MKHAKLSLTTKYVVIVCALLLAGSVLLGVALMRQSGKAMNTLIRQHMRSIADTAAALMDGDELKTITAKDVGSEKCNRICATLTTVKDAQKNADIKYIYLVKREGDHYVFTLDPDPVKPAKYGDKVVSVPAQDIAWAGESAVDNAPYEDQWGVYYTAWSPIRDSYQQVVGMVGVDFVADSYDQQIAAHTRTAVIISCISLLVGGLIMLLMMGQLRRRFRLLGRELTVLSQDLEQLSDEIKNQPGNEQEEEEKPAETEPITAEADLVGVLGGKIRSMQMSLREYLAFIRKQAYMDTMTGVGNKTAYLDHVKEIGEEINAGTAAFAVVVFDINGLKYINDNYGHECGDRVIVDAAKVIRRVFPKDQVFRIGGDEFIALLGETSPERLDTRLGYLDKEIEIFNRSEKKYTMTMSFSYGGAVYRPGKDSDYKEVFKRADRAMYHNKDDYYKDNGDFRRQDEENQ